MRLVAAIALFLLGPVSIKGQGIEPGAILVGDAVPVRELRNMINYPGKTLPFADHKAKVTILDFWSTNCRGCIEFWPKLQELQKEFGSNLRVVLVNMYEDEKEVRDFFAQRKKASGLVVNLPISCRDSVLWAPFNRRGVPRYYWIDTNGVLASVTHRDQVTSANIRKWISSGPFPLNQIIEEMHNVDPSKPIFVDGNGGKYRSDAFIWSSSLTKAFRDIMGSTKELKDSINGYSICKTGTNLYGLYATAYNNRLAPGDFLTFLHRSRFSIKTKDSIEARFNYQLIAGRPMTRDQLQKAMQEDLNRYFGLKVRWEKRQKNCLVISMFDSTKTQNNSTDYDCFVGDTGTALDKVTIHEAIFFMEQGSFFYDQRPIVDETNYKGLLLGVRFKANCYNLKDFDKGLSKFGMHVSEELRDVDVLVVSDP